MSGISRTLTALGALLLIGLFLFPMWSIRLEAPQYHGENALGILIHVNKLEGTKPNDLENINGLNHYIGMKRIEPESIPELGYMQYVVMALIALGLIVAFVGKRQFLLIWVLLLVTAGALGMYDFYTWEYDYGHNLDPHAIIKIEGMSYQPPLVGSKQLLNFTAHSYPANGFYFIIASGALVAFAWWSSRPRKGTKVTT